MEILDLDGTVHIEADESRAELNSLDVLSKNLRAGFDTMTAGMAASLSRLDTSISTLSTTIEEKFRKAVKPPAPNLNPIREAFASLGVAMQSDLDAQAAAAKSAYETIANSGSANARELEAAWKASQAAISRALAEPLPVPVTDPVEAAFQELGVSIQADLDRAAASARAAFETISSSGRANARELEAAWQAAATAIAAAAATETAEAGRNWEELGSKISQTASGLSEIGQVLSVGVTAPVVASGYAVLKLGSDFETAFAGVRKTVSMSEADLGKLRTEIRQMAQDIPATVEEISKVAEAAGQLGIKNEAIMGFTRTMIDMGIASNMSADEAANALARLANITQMPQENFDRLGATVVALGNKLATTESEVVNMGLRLAGAGHQIKLTEAEILGFAAALASVGIEAEAGGSAMSRVFISIDQAARKGGSALSLFAKTAGMSAAQFKKAYQEDAAGAIVTFIEGLGRVNKAGGNVFDVLEKLGLSEIRVRDALLRAAGAGTLFAESLEIGSAAWRDNDALTKEALERYKTLDSQWKIFQNRLKEVALEIFDTLRPALMQVMGLLMQFAGILKDAGTWFSSLPEGVKLAIVGFLGLIAAVGPLLLILSQLAGAVGAIVEMFALFGPAAAGAGAAAAGGTTAMGGLGAAIASIAGPIAIAIAAVVALVAAYSTNFAGIRDIIDDIFKTIGEIIGKVVAVFRDNAGTISQIWQGIKEIFAGVVAAIGQYMAALLNVIRAVLKAINGDWHGAWEALKAAAVNVWEGIKAEIQGRVEGIPRILSAVWEAVKSGLAAAWEGLKVIAANALNAVLEKLNEWALQGQAKIKEFEEILKDDAKFQAFVIMVGEKLAAVTAKISEWAGNAIIAILAGLGSLPVRAMNFFIDLLARIVVWGVQLGARMASIGVDLVLAFAKAIAPLVQELGKVLIQMVAKLSDPVELFKMAYNLGAGIVKNFRFGFEKKSPSGPEKDVTEMAEKIPAIIESGIAPAGAAANKTGKKIKQEFALGFAGFEKLVEGIAQKLIDSPASLDKALAPSFKKAKQGVREGFDDILKTVNDYLASQGKANRLSAEQLLDLAKNHKDVAKDLINTSREWQKANEAAQTAMLVTFKSSIPQINEYLKSIGVTKQFTAKTFVAAGASITETIDRETQAFIKNKEAAASAETIQAKIAAAYLKTHPPILQTIEYTNVLTAANDKLIGGMGKIPDSLGALTAAMDLHAEGSITATTKIEEGFKKAQEAIVTGAVPEIISALGSLHTIFVEVGKANGLTTEQIEAAWKKAVESLGGDAIPKLQGTIRQVGAEFGKLPPTVKGELDKLKETVGDGMAAVIEVMLKATGRLTPGVVADVNRTADGILQVIGNLPGKVGDKLRKVTDAVQDWIGKIDGILKGLHKIWDKIPDGIGKALESLLGMFKKNTGAVNTTLDTMKGTAKEAATGVGQATGDMTKSTEGMSEGMSKALGTAMAAMGAFTTGMVTASATGSKALGSIMGGMQGAMTGFMAGGPVGAVIGGVAGILGGLFGGKNKHQKEMERLAEEKAKVELEGLKEGLKKAYQETVEAAFKTMQEAAKLLEKLDDFTPVHREIIRRFFKNLSQVLGLFVELAGQFSSDNLTQVKALGEALGPIIDAAGAALEVFEKLLTFISPTETRIKAFGAALVVLIGVFIAVTENFKLKALKQARRFAENMTEIVGLINDAAAAFTAVDEAVIPAQQAFRNLAVGIEIALNELIAIIAFVDNAGLKRAALFSDRARAVLELLRAAVEVFTGVNGFSHVPRQQLQILADAVRAAIEELNRSLAGIDDEAMAIAGRRASAASPLVQLIASVIEPFIKISSLTKVPTESIEALAASIRLAILEFDEALNSIALEIVQGASQRAELSKAILDALGSAADAFSKIAAMSGADYYNLIAGVVDMMRFAVERFIKEAAGLDTAALSSAAKLSESVKVILDVLGNAAAVIKTLSEIQGASIQQVVDLVGGIRLIIVSMGRLSDEVGGEATTKIVEFATRIRTVLEILEYALKLFTSIGEFAGLPQEALSNVLAAFDDTIATLNAMLDKANEAREIAEQIRDAMRDAASAVQEALSFPASATAGTTNITVQTSAQPAGPSARSTTVVTSGVGSSVATRGAGGQGETHNHYYYGDTNFETRVEDIQTLRDAEAMIERDARLLDERRARRFNTRG